MAFLQQKTLVLRTRTIHLQSLEKIDLSAERICGDGIINEVCGSQIAAAIHSPERSHDKNSRQDAAYSSDQAERNPFGSSQQSRNHCDQRDDKGSAVIAESRVTQHDCSNRRKGDQYGPAWLLTLVISIDPPAPKDHDRKPEKWPQKQARQACQRVRGGCQSVYVVRGVFIIIQQPSEGVKGQKKTRNPESKAKPIEPPRGQRKISCFFLRPARFLFSNGTP